MNKIVLILCLFLAAAKGQIKDVTTYNVQAERTNDYINLNRLQQSKVLQDFDTQLNFFKTDYTGRVDSLKVQLDMVTASVVHMEERLNPLELLGDISNQCVVKYRKTIPTVEYTKATYTSCINQANNELTNMMAPPLNHRNLMQNYFSTYFEAEIKKCADKFNKTTGNYTSCITVVTSNTNSNIANYQKIFGTLMDTAECSAKAYIKRAFDCCYTIETRTNSQIAESNVLINNCMLGKDECKPCPATCTESMDLKVNYQNATIPNPFYGLKSHKGCLLLSLQD